MVIILKPINYLKKKQSALAPYHPLDYWIFIYIGGYLKSIYAAVPTTAYYVFDIPTVRYNYHILSWNTLKAVLNRDFYFVLVANFRLRAREITIGMNSLSSYIFNVQKQTFIDLRDERSSLFT